MPKITALTADTSPTVDDLIATVTDPTGTPSSRKAEIADLWKVLPISGSRVDTDQTTNSTSYADLATVGPSVTLTLKGTVAIVWLSCIAYKPANSDTLWVSVAVSGATTLAASDANALSSWSHALNAHIQLAGCIVLTGLTPGANTFTMRYKLTTGASVANFYARNITVFAP